MDQYEKLEKVGEGTYGKVYKAREINTGKLVALKKTRLDVRGSGCLQAIRLCCKMVDLLHAVAPHRWKRRACHPPPCARCLCCRCSVTATTSSSMLLVVKERLAINHTQFPPTLFRLLCVEHVEENNKPVLYLVFEYLNTDLKRFMDRNGKGPAHPLPKPLIKVLCMCTMFFIEGCIA